MSQIKVPLLYSFQDGAKTPDGRKLRDVMARCEVLTTERKRSEFKARDVEQDMARLVKGSAEQHRALGDTENAAAALAAVLSYTVSCKWTVGWTCVPDLESLFGFEARLLRELSRAAQGAG
jgi:hypothetical protein